MSYQRLGLCAGALLCILLPACGAGPQDEAGTINAKLQQALDQLNQEPDALSLPKLGAHKVAEQGRLPIVDAALKRPPRMIDLSRRLASAEPGNSTAAYLRDLLATLELSIAAPAAAQAAPLDAPAIWAALFAARPGIAPPPAQLHEADPLGKALRELLPALLKAQQTLDSAGGQATASELAAIKDQLELIVKKPEPKPESERWLMPLIYHQIGARANSAALAGGMLDLVDAVQSTLPALREAAQANPSVSLEWETPLGRIAVAGTGSDTHRGAYLLLIDLGGDDRYEDVGRPLQTRGVSLVIDLAGNDTVRSGGLPGPGAAVFGIDVWADLQGNDRYLGGNMTAGAALLGAGLLWDAQGDDSYHGGSMSQGVGQYGVGILLDAQGNDSYTAGIAAQGFGGPGGFGILDDLSGNDTYNCGKLTPDQAADRISRHAGVHYLGMCQGYSFGLRPEASGGVGLLLDRGGDDQYRADLFAQGGGYWFGLGMLVDAKGNDRYQAFEHCQGAGLHLGAGVLADLGGDDSYTAYEHCQGAGIDRAAGVLFDAAGNDNYSSVRQAQGAGIKPYGVGLMIDMLGDDRYAADVESQGYSLLPPEFPQEQVPLGLLLDFAGNNDFQQQDVQPPNDAGRRAGRAGIAYDK